MQTELKDGSFLWQEKISVGEKLSPESPAALEEGIMRSFMSGTTESVSQYV